MAVGESKRPFGKIGRYFTASAKTRKPVAMMAKVIEISVHLGK